METQQYLATFCKPCPTKDMMEEWMSHHPTFKLPNSGENTKPHGCGRMIYKDKGCNHMWSCPCGFHWCWHCAGPYHGSEEVTQNGKTTRMEYHNDYFTCKNVDQKAAEKAVGDEAKKLHRWKQISDSYATALQAEKTDDKMRERVEAICEEMRATPDFNDPASSKAFSEGDCEELKKAAEALFESRRVVKFTYVREFLLETKIHKAESAREAEARASPSPSLGRPPPPRPPPPPRRGRGKTEGPSAPAPSRPLARACPR